jgi:hypothetical protein
MGRERNMDREREIKRGGERVRKRERELHTCTNRKCGRAESPSVSHSVSQ